MEEKIKGILNGIGVGCGDPDMLTLEAIKTIKRSDIICLPHRDRQKCRAYQTARAAVPETDEKEIVCFDFEMIKDSTILEKRHQEIYSKVKEYLEEGKNVSFLTIGDPTVYSTFSYIARLAERDGAKVRTVNGISSINASAARLGISLCDGDEQLHVISQIEDLEKTLALPGTKVIMKCCRSMPFIKKCLSDMEKKVEIYAVEECGTEQEKLYYGVNQLPDDPGYMMTIIVKERK